MSEIVAMKVCVALLMLSVFVGAIWGAIDDEWNRVRGFFMGAIAGPMFCFLALVFVFLFSAGISFLFGASPT